MSAFGSKADIALLRCTCLLLTQSGHFIPGEGIELTQINAANPTLVAQSQEKI